MRDVMEERLATLLQLIHRRIRRLIMSFVGTDYDVGVMVERMTLALSAVSSFPPFDGVRSLIDIN